MVALPCLLVRTFMEVMSICRSVNTLEISTNIPIRLFAKIWISVEYRSLLPAALWLPATPHRSDVPAHTQARLMILIQSVRWMDTPRPLVTKPTISSPGTGLQHLENRTATSWIPFTMMPLLDFLRCFQALFRSVSPMPSKTGRRR